MNHLPASYVQRHMVNIAPSPSVEKQIPGLCLRRADLRSHVCLCPRRMGKRDPELLVDPHREP